MLRRTAVGVLLALVAGCTGTGPGPRTPSVPGESPEMTSPPAPGSTPSGSTVAASPQAPAPPRYETLPELVEAVARRTVADRTSEAEQVARTLGGGRPERVSRSRTSTVLHDSAPPSVRTVLQEQVAGSSPVVTQIVLTPDDVFARPDRRVWPEPRPPWTRLDPAGRDPLSAQLMPIVEDQRRSAEGPGCLEAAANATITGSASDNVGGFTTVRYTLDLRVDDASVDRPGSGGFRQRGVTWAEAIVNLDDQDRVRRCEIHAEFPDGGSYVSDQHLISQGDPVEITAPPSGLVQPRPGPGR